ncbi:MAG: glucose-6-phosphate isomerase, partial [Gemmatimonadetes bacterium]|nr:glucose-6-phosphate isomerase [Gemmatimonadota bacterium]
LIGVHPFDEPDVNLAKDRARAALARSTDLAAGAGVPQMEAPETALEGLLSRVGDGDYLALAAFLPETDDLTEAFGQLRSAVTSRTGVATTFGYGPRYLHSTGQLHKGGPDSAVVLLLAAGDSPPLAIPGEPHGFDALAAAQARGDLDALLSVGRRAALASLHDDYAKGIRRLAGSVTG